MTKDDTEIVSALRNALAGKVGQQRFDLWFGAGTRFELKDGSLLVRSPNWFFRDWLVSNFRPDLEAACLTVLGTCPTFDFSVDASLPQPDPAMAPSLASSVSKLSAVAAPEHSSSASPVSPSVRAPQRSDAAPPAGNGSARARRMDFRSFVVGASNRLAQAAAEMVVARPGEMSPLVLHGTTGVGKTHLLEALCHAVRGRRPGATAIYLTAEQFTSGFLQALRGSGLPSFRQKYRSVELLAIDDLQFFCGKNARYTQLELLYTIDTFLRDRRQIVFAADRSPAELSELGQEMRTRLEGGMVCRIDTPEYETRLGILGQMAERFGVSLPADVQTLVASRLTSHARELSGAICRLRATSEALGRPIGVEMAEEALADMLRPMGRLVRLPDIAKAVGDAFGVDPRCLQSGRKAKSFSYPRMLAMWLARKYTRAALSEIGEYFGKRSHSTVISAQKRVETWLAGSMDVELVDSVCSIDQAIRCVEQRLLAG